MLSADAVQHANAGLPGLPMGAASMSFTADRVVAAALRFLGKANEVAQEHGFEATLVTV